MNAREDMRPCLNELQKEYCVKIKLLALDRKHVTLMSWCQMSRDIHSSPLVMHKVEGKHIIFGEIEVNVIKLDGVGPVGNRPSTD